MQRVEGFILLGLLCVLTPRRALADESAPAIPGVDRQVQLSQTTGPTPVLPPLPPMPAARPNTTTPGQP
jgi:hypothetical protein